MKITSFPFIFKAFLLVQAIFYCDILCQGQTQIEWEKCYGGSDFENGGIAKVTNDGGYIIATTTYSTDGDIQGNHGRFDIWIAKVNASNNILWKRCYGGTQNEFISDIIQTNDNEFFFTGSTDSNDGDVAGNHGESDMWVVKLNSEGEIIWQKCLGGSDDDWGNTILRNSDGNFIIAGSSHSLDGNVTWNHGKSDFWICEINEYGSLIWQKCFGGSEYDFSPDICLTSDDELIVVGRSSSNDGDVTGNNGGSDIWVLKLSKSREIIWQKCFGGYDNDGAESIKQLTNGESVIVGYLKDLHGTPGLAYCIVINEMGQKVWDQYCSWGGGSDIFHDVVELIDGSLFCVGYSDNAPNPPFQHGKNDYWLVHFNQNGEILSQTFYGGSENDNASHISITDDGGFLLSGVTDSNDGDVSFNHGDGDSWVIKLPQTMSINNFLEEGSFIFFPNPCYDGLSINRPPYFDEYKGEVDIELINIFGSDYIYNFKINDDILDVSKLPRGIYICRLTFNKQYKFCGKLILQ